MLVTKYSIIICALMFSPAAVFAHGEDKPGPHGGEIRMPGAFHTEVVKLSGSSVRIYLSDISFKDPTIEDSTLELSLNLDGKISNATCKPADSAFDCSFDGVTLDGAGSLIVKASRKGANGIAVKYALPLGARREGESRQP